MQSQVELFLELVFAKSSSASASIKSELHFDESFHIKKFGFLDGNFLYFVHFSMHILDKLILTYKKCDFLSLRKKSEYSYFTQIFCLNNWYIQISDLKLKLKVC